MLTYDDCLGLCNLSEEEIEAIAMHEHIPQIAALELGNYLLCGPDGVPRIKRIIIEDIEHAEQLQDKQRALQLKLVLKHFIDTHPENPARESAPA